LPWVVELDVAGIDFATVDVARYEQAQSEAGPTPDPPLI